VSVVVYDQGVAVDDAYVSFHAGGVEVVQGSRLGGVDVNAEVLTAHRGRGLDLLGAGAGGLGCGAAGLLLGVDLAVRGRRPSRRG